MVRFKLNFELGDGSCDSLVVQAETIEEIQEIAKEEFDKRNATDAWSEEI